MKHSFVPKNFVVQELVPRVMYEKYGESAIRYIDPRLCKVLEQLRECIDMPMTINNWHSGGGREWSGLRTPDSPYYSLGSAHTYGMAFDAVGNWDADEVRRKVIDRVVPLAFPVRLELGISWLHVDVMRSAENPEVFTFYP